MTYLDALKRYERRLIKETARLHREHSKDLNEAIDPAVDEGTVPEDEDDVVLNVTDECGGTPVSEADPDAADSDTIDVVDDVDDDGADDLLAVDDEPEADDDEGFDVVDAEEDVVGEEEFVELDEVNDAELTDGKCDERPIGDGEPVSETEKVELVPLAKFLDGLPANGKEGAPGADDGGAIVGEEGAEEGSEEGAEDPEADQVGEGLTMTLDELIAMNDRSLEANGLSEDAPLLVDPSAITMAGNLDEDGDGEGDADEGEGEGEKKEEEAPAPAEGEGEGGEADKPAPGDGEDAEAEGSEDSGEDGEKAEEKPAEEEPAEDADSEEKKSEDKAEPEKKDDEKSDDEGEGKSDDGEGEKKAEKKAEPKDSDEDEDEEYTTLEDPNAEEKLDEAIIASVKRNKRLFKK